ncbi:uncharacterized protein LOC144752466 [Lissotriton helveticus]
MVETHIRKARSTGAFGPDQISIKALQPRHGKFVWRFQSRLIRRVHHGVSIPAVYRRSRPDTAFLTLLTLNQTHLNKHWSISINFLDVSVSFLSHFSASMVSSSSTTGI